MDQSEMKSFEEFWKFYVGEHSKRGTRVAHAAGTITGMGLLFFLMATRKWRYLPLALLPGYGAAWFGHFFIEKNRPATFKYPLWSLIADYKMIGLMAAGKMQAELRDSTKRNASC
jgi:hypothetical protein